MNRNFSGGGSKIEIAGPDAQLRRYGHRIPFRAELPVVHNGDGLSLGAGDALNFFRPLGAVAAFPLVIEGQRIFVDLDDAGEFDLGGALAGIGLDIVRIWPAPSTVRATRAESAAIENLFIDILKPPECNLFNAVPLYKMRLSQPFGAVKLFCGLRPVFQVSSFWFQVAKPEGRTAGRSDSRKAGQPDSGNAGKSGTAGMRESRKAKGQDGRTAGRRECGNAGKPERGKAQKPEMRAHREQSRPPPALPR